MAPVSMLFYLFIEMNHYQRGYKKKESKHLINSDPIFKLDFKRTILANQLIILISCFTTFSFFFLILCSFAIVQTKNTLKINPLKMCNRKAGCWFYPNIKKNWHSMQNIWNHVASNYRCFIIQFTAIVLSIFFLPWKNSHIHTVMRETFMFDIYMI